jgi:hypothetical protein
MAHTFDDDALRGVLGHMNADHTDDNLLIARAFGDGDALSATMTGFDGDGGEWDVVGADGATSSLRVSWPGGAITERREVRREIVALYDAACDRLGVEARPHD